MYRTQAPPSPTTSLPSHFNIYAPTNIKVAIDTGHSTPGVRGVIDWIKKFTLPSAIAVVGSGSVMTWMLYKFVGKDNKHNKRNLFLLNILIICSEEIFE